jgi:hypothetical protein
MIPPPPQGDVYDIPPPDTPNLEAWGFYLCWDAWRTLAGQGLPEFITEMQITRGIPA